MIKFKPVRPMQWELEEHPPGPIDTSPGERVFVLTELSEYVYKPKLSLDEFEEKLLNTFDLEKIDLQKLDKDSLLYKSAIRMKNICPNADFDHSLYGLIKNEKSESFYRCTRFQGGERFAEESDDFECILIVKDPSNDFFWSNEMYLDPFLRMYQGIDEDDSESNKVNKLYSLYYYLAVDGFNLMLWHYLQEIGEEYFVIPNAER